MSPSARLIRFVGGPWSGRHILTDRTTYEATDTEVGGAVHKVIYDIDHDTGLARPRKDDWEWAKWPWQLCQARRGDGTRCELRGRDHRVHAREQGMEIITWMDGPCAVLGSQDRPADAAAAYAQVNGRAERDRVAAERERVEALRARAGIEDSLQYMTWVAGNHERAKDAAEAKLAKVPTAVRAALREHLDLNAGEVSVVADAVTTALDACLQPESTAVDGECRHPDGTRHTDHGPWNKTKQRYEDGCKP